MAFFISGVPDENQVFSFTTWRSWQILCQSCVISENRPIYPGSLSITWISLVTKTVLLTALDLQGAVLFIQRVSAKVHHAGSCRGDPWWKQKKNVHLIFWSLRVEYNSQNRPSKPRITQILLNLEWSETIRLIPIIAFALLNWRLQLFSLCKALCFISQL